MGDECLYVDRMSPRCVWPYFSMMKNVCLHHFEVTQYRVYTHVHDIVNYMEKKAI